jgi:Rrf2 family transcriptional regulator, cysteine metabolism repressor
MLKMSTQARYSLRMMMAIAKLGAPGKPVGLRDVSRHTNLSRRYLEQLVGPLRNRGLLVSVSGRSGGYLLAEEAHEISVGRILEAAVGPVELTECVLDESNCLHSDFCSCRHLWTLLTAKIASTLSETTLQDLLGGSWVERARTELAELDWPPPNDNPSKLGPPWSDATDS